MSSDDSLKRITKGGLIFFIGIIISKILVYIYRLILARTGPEQYGLISLGIAILGVSTTVSLLGLNQGVIRYISFYKTKKELLKVKEVIFSAIKLTLPLSLVITILLVLFSKQISIEFFDNIDLDIVVKVVAIALPFSVLREIFFNTFISFEKVQYEVYTKSLIENISKIILTVLFIFLGWKIMGISVAYTLSIIISFFAALYLLKTKIFSQIEGKVSAFMINKELILYSLPLLLSNFIFSLMLWTDTLMIGYFLPESQVGIYNAALPTAFLISMVPTALFTLFVPILIEIYTKKENENFKIVYKTVTKWVLLLNLVLLSTFFLFSKEILSILFGQEYAIASTSLIILSFGYFIGYFIGASQSVLLVFKKTKLILLNTVIMIIGNVVLNFYLIPIYGINGAAIATAFIFIIRAIFLTIETFFITKLVPLKSSFIKIIFSMIIAAIMTKYISSKFVPTLFIVLSSILFMIIIYLLLLLITRVFEKEDIMIIKTMQQKTGKDFTKINKILNMFGRNDD